MTRRLPLPLHLATVALLLVAAVGLASCAEDAARSDVGLDSPANETVPAEGSTANGADDLVGDARQAIGQWVLLEGTVDGEAIDVPGGEQITMEITRTQVVGASACNQYSATATIDGDEMTVDAPTTTRMLCADDAMAAESAYIDGLQRITSLDSDGEELVLTGDGVELRFVAA
ncbi:Lipoprotein [Euzebya pacifica]|uniref:Lipoprotein n=1 Tax=Euzebya pacifica TaxID=1608957 RepID=A0A346Y4C2_9ACTN|nr:META domain-containing protein [Euzebya pacifica]AXV09319.1 Lipoprotein [Euzebya pacifica]